MVNIVVYGPGCSRCVETERVVRHVVEQMGITAEVHKVNDPIGMAKAGVLLTPAVDSQWSCQGLRPYSERRRGQRMARLVFSDDRPLSGPQVGAKLRPEVSRGEKKT